ncbi:radical SAM/SPASM domain-containing protein [Acidobacteriota bacterium]
MKLGLLSSYIRALIGILHGTRAFGGPVQAVLNLTNRCNLRCIHCHFNSERVVTPLFPAVRKDLLGPGASERNQRPERSAAYADPVVFNGFIQELLSMGTRRFEINACGEPFMHECALDFIEVIKTSGGYCTAFTNGTCFDKAAVDKLVHLGFDDLKVSILAGTPDLYMKTHPGVSSSTFDRIEESLLYFAERKAELNAARPRVILVFVVFSVNRHGIGEFVDFARKVRADGVLFSPFDNAGGDIGLDELALSEEASQTVLKDLNRLQPQLQSWGLDNNIEQFKRIFANGLLDTSRFYRHIPCYFGWLTPALFPDGNLYPCSRSFEPLGNIHERSFKKIWYGRAYRDFRRQALTLPQRKSPVDQCDCSRCVNHTANFRVYQAVHPLRSRPSRLQHLFENEPEG